MYIVSQSTNFLRDHVPFVRQRIFNSPRTLSSKVQINEASDKLERNEKESCHRTFNYHQGEARKHFLFRFKNPSSNLKITNERQIFTFGFIFKSENSSKNRHEADNSVLICLQTTATQGSLVDECEAIFSIDKSFKMHEFEMS